MPLLRISARVILSEKMTIWSSDEAEMALRVKGYEQLIQDLRKVAPHLILAGPVRVTDEKHQRNMKMKDLRGKDCSSCDLILARMRNIRKR